MFDVVVGIFAFGSMMSIIGSQMLKKEHRINSLRYLVASTLIFFTFFGSLFALSKFPNEQSKTKANEECSDGQVMCYAGTKECTSSEECKKRVEEINKNALSHPEATIFSQNKAKTVNQVQNNNNQIECIGPDGKHFDTTMDKCVELNEKWGKKVDYMTNCNIQPECGGGTELMAKSQCDLPCSGKSIKTTVSPTTQQTTPTSKLNFYCYDNANNFSYYTSSGEQCNLDNIKSMCKKTAKELFYNPCMDTCLSDANDLSAYCIYNLPESERGQCLSEQDATYQQCMDACGDTYQAEYTKCN